jgi:uncharacterized membrane protein
MVSLVDCRRGTLSAMADDASKPVERVWNRGVLPEGLLIHVAETGLVQSKVARCAAVNDSQFRKPDLMNARLEATSKAQGIAAITNHSEIMALVTVPLTEMFLRRCNCQRE